jgi:hypothetical protein
MSKAERNELAKVMNAETIRSLATALGVPILDLLVLHRNNDPFNADTPGKRKKAQWFAGLWQDLNLANSHLRRMHYKIISQKRRVKLPDGRPFENTERCWDILRQSSGFARHLGLVDPGQFQDHRNPEPHLHVNHGWRDSPSYIVQGLVSGSLPFIRSELVSALDFSISGVEVHGYDYSKEDQPYHLELWIEKSTMNDVLEPVCQQRGINLVTSVGFQSITSAIQLLKRIARIQQVRPGVPARIFWVADFDPAGDSMPVAVARCVEFYRNQLAPGADIKIMALALNRQQVVDYDLPRIPIKDGDSRKTNFEDRRGQGAVELDALEALHPGVLAQIVRDAAAPYRDKTLAERFAEAEAEAQEWANSSWAEETEDLRQQLEEIAEQARTICAPYERQLQVHGPVGRVQAASRG